MFERPIAVTIRGRGPDDEDAVHFRPAAFPGSAMTGEPPGPAAIGAIPNGRSALVRSYPERARIAEGRSTRRAVFVVMMTAILLSVWTSVATARYPETPPRVLLVQAHPDDESAYAATVYKITHDLHGEVDLALITNGEGGYKYSTLGGEYYHLDLTQEAVGRKYLPRIRRKELESAGRILGINHYTFFGQKDARYTLSVHEALDSLWNVPRVRRGLESLLTKGHYDFVFTLLPSDSTHGHHKGACILALDAVRALPDTAARPIVLAVTVSSKGGPDSTRFSELAGYPQTRVSDHAPAFFFDRTQSFGFRHVLNYKIIVNWDIAEHKSQGTMQLSMNDGDVEDFWYFDMNPASGRSRARSLFDALAVNRYPELTYPEVSRNRLVRRLR